MAKRNSRNTRGRIISAAWKLFYEQGYDGTTVEDIVFESGTSKGSFYHYFDGKDALMGTLAYVFDEKYEDLMPTLNPEKGAIETLAYINHELYVMIESSVSIDLLTRLLSTQLLARGEKHGFSVCVFCFYFFESRFYIAFQSFSFCMKLGLVYQGHFFIQLFYIWRIRVICYKFVVSI